MKYGGLICVINLVTPFQGIPIIYDCAAVMECRAHSVHTVGDHHVWYGSVFNAEISESEDNPLLYYIRSEAVIKTDIVTFHWIK